MLILVEETFVDGVASLVDCEEAFAADIHSLADDVERIVNDGEVIDCDVLYDLVTFSLVDAEMVIVDCV